MAAEGKACLAAVYTIGAWDPGAEAYLCARQGPASNAGNSTQPWTVLPVTGGATLSAGTSYAPAFYSSFRGLRYDSVASDSYNMESDMPAAPYAWVIFANRTYSIYATYTATPSGPANVKGVGGLVAASVKDVGGLAFADIKNIGGLA
jgi:hypothetical protein